MATLVIALRAIHIVAGIFWAGAAIMMYGFVMPSAVATRPDSTRFMRHLATASGLPTWMTIASLSSVVAGLALYAPISGQFDRDWLHSTRGIVLSVGALLGVGAAIEGLVITGPTARRLGAMASRITGEPTQDQARQLGEMQAKLQRVGTRGAWTLGIAATLMAVARYV